MDKDKFNWKSDVQPEDEWAVPLGVISVSIVESLTTALADIITTALGANMAAYLKLRTPGFDEERFVLVFEEALHRAADASEMQLLEDMVRREDEENTG